MLRCPFCSETARRLQAERLWRIGPARCPQGRWQRGWSMFLLHGCACQDASQVDDGEQWHCDGNHEHLFSRPCSCSCCRSTYKCPGLVACPCPRRRTVALYSTFSSTSGPTTNPTIIPAAAPASTTYLPSQVHQTHDRTESLPGILPPPRDFPLAHGRLYQSGHLQTAIGLSTEREGLSWVHAAQWMS